MYAIRSYYGGIGADDLEARVDVAKLQAQVHLHVAVNDGRKTLGVKGDEAQR